MSMLVRRYVFSEFGHKAEFNLGLMYVGYVPDYLSPQDVVV
jgi:hypothetical protein